MWDLLTHLAGPAFGGQSACADVDPDMFFPLPGDQAGVEVARQVCAGCEIRSACAEFAVRRGMAYGIWGGLTEDERRDMRARGRGWRPPVAQRREGSHRSVESVVEQGESDDPLDGQAVEARARRARRWAEMTPEQRREYRARKAEKARGYRARQRAQRTQATVGVPRTEGAA